MRVAYSLTWLFGVCVVIACGTTHSTTTGDGAADDGGDVGDGACPLGANCGYIMRCAYPKGCKDPTPACLPNTCGDATLIVFCDCDGFAFYGGGCSSPDRPWQSLYSGKGPAPPPGTPCFPDAGADAAADATQD